MKKTNVSDKITELTSVLSTQCSGSLNLARIKLIALFICSLCKVQTVTFSKLANAFDSSSESASSLRRIQRFMADFSLDRDFVARLIFNLLPNKADKLILSIDRTNWKFGQLDINIFMLGIVYEGVAFPLLFTMLKKRGNSNTQERIDLVERFITLFGKDCIDALVADREFVGQKWIEYLNQEEIKYHIRIRANFKIFLPRKNKEVKAFWLFNNLKAGDYKVYDKIVKLGDQYCYVSGCKLSKGDFLILISFNNPNQAQAHYKQRWQIEMCFKAMKSSGFDIEKTHLNKIERIEKLVLLVMIAFVWCYKVGIYLHKLKPIKIKTHGRKAKSIFKYGLDYIANSLLNTLNQDFINLTQFLSCT
ncbi:MAG: IS4 family transposase [Flavobacteriales bacterium]